MLAKEENKIYVYGLEKSEDLKNIENIMMCDSIKKAIEKTEIVIGPIPFSSNGTTINAPFSENEISIREMMHVISAKVLIAGGILPEVYELANDEYIEIIDIECVNLLVRMNFGSEEQFKIVYSNKRPIILPVKYCYIKKVSTLFYARHNRVYHKYSPASSGCLRKIARLSWETFLFNK